VNPAEGAGDTGDSPSQHVNVSINLLAALGKFLVQLQRLADFVSIGVTGVEKVEEADYKSSPFSYSFQVAGEHRIPYPQIKEEFANWCIKNSFTEAIDILSMFLEECRLLAALYTLGSGTVSGEQWNQVWVEERSKFHRLSFPDKIKQLKTKYGVQSQFEEFVLSLNGARRCLIHRLGYVGPEDTKGSDYLAVKWHGIEFYTRDKVTGEETPVALQKPTEHESELILRSGPIEKQFRLAERIKLSPTELFHTIRTFHLFAVELLQAVERMAPSAADKQARP